MTEADLQKPESCHECTGEIIFYGVKYNIILNNEKLAFCSEECMLNFASKESLRKPKGVPFP